MWQRIISNNNGYCQWRSMQQPATVTINVVTNTGGIQGWRRNSVVTLAVACHRQQCQWQQRNQPSSSAT